MKLRIAIRSDLPQLKEVYTRIYKGMQTAGIFLWNEDYPWNTLPGDIELKRLWVVCDGDNIAAAFAIDRCTETDGVTWQQPEATAAVIMRLGVDPNYQRRHLGEKCLEYAGDVARKAGFGYLRMLVVDSNVPAEKFYIRCGCIKAAGAHIEHVDGIPGKLTEYGYEIKL